LPVAPLRVLPLLALTGLAVTGLAVTGLAVTGLAVTRLAVSGLSRVISLTGLAGRRRVGRAAAIRIGGLRDSAILIRVADLCCLTGLTGAGRLPRLCCRLNILVRVAGLGRGGGLSRIGGLGLAVLGLPGRLVRVCGRTE
jgi:hypothetical protein